MNRIKSTIILMSLYSLSLTAQKTSLEGNFVQFSFGVKKNTLFDTAISALQYDGLASSAKFSYTTNNANMKTWIEVAFDGGYLNKNKPLSFQNRDINHFAGMYNIGLTKPVLKFSNRLYLWAGGTITGEYYYNSIRAYVNNKNNYSFNNSFGINQMLRYTFYTVNRWSVLEWYVNVPFFNYYARPGYAVNFPENKFGDLFLVSFSNYLRLDSQFRFIVPLKNNNKLAIEYDWSYYSLLEKNKVQYASHSIFLTLYFKL